MGKTEQPSFLFFTDLVDMFMAPETNSSELWIDIATKKNSSRNTEWCLKDIIFGDITILETEHFEHIGKGAH